MIRTIIKLLRAGDRIADRAVRGECRVANEVAEAARAERDEYLNSYGRVKARLRDISELLRDATSGPNEGPLALEDYAKRIIAERDAALADLRACQTALSMEQNRSELLREDIEGVHLWLDKQGALRDGVGDRLSIVGRIQRLLGNAKADEPNKNACRSTCDGETHAADCPWAAFNRGKVQP